MSQDQNDEENNLAARIANLEAKSEQMTQGLLTDAERQQLQVELTALRADLDAYHAKYVARRDH